MWLFCLWDTGADSIILSGDELTQMASVTIHSSLCQCIQGAIQYVENVSLLNWLMEGCCGAWPNEGDLPMARPCWMSTPELQVFFRERGMLFISKHLKVLMRCHLLQVCKIASSSCPAGLSWYFGACPVHSSGEGNPGSSMGCCPFREN